MPKPSTITTSSGARPRTTSKSSRRIWPWIASAVIVSGPISSVSYCMAWPISCFLLCAIICKEPPGVSWRLKRSGGGFSNWELESDKPPDVSGSTVPPAIPNNKPFCSFCTESALGPDSQLTDLPLHHRSCLVLQPNCVLIRLFGSHFRLFQLTSPEFSDQKAQLHSLFR